MLMLSLTCFSVGGFHQSRDPPPSTDDNVGQMGDVSFRGAPESVASADPSRAGSAGYQSDTDPSEDALNPALPSQPRLFEDPLVLNTPRVSIPRNNEAAFKRNKWPQRTKFPSVSRNLYCYCIYICIAFI